jgi:hypothetical protein
MFGIEHRTNSTGIQISLCGSRKFDTGTTEFSIDTGSNGPKTLFGSIARFSHNHPPNRLLYRRSNVGYNRSGKEDNMWLVWLLTGAIGLTLVTVIIFAIAWQMAKFWHVQDLEKHVKKREEILKESEGLLNERWEKLRAAEKTFIKDKETERKKLEGFAKAVEGRAKELGYIGRETWQDEEFNDLFGEDDADPEPT